ncbi:DNA-binding CsgD family transcriptional regulator/PAS domain-containing protein [Hydrogenophaga palleronii]|uniref:DNA-binding CsgD family transcriptional regulator/PAS domain-containing protein n=1 Tax=Hydrogenophaga palleronii TaxID=65655 RepID=A0ABU1WKD4_9BURK|nr:helix-turn-helix transcriptional regulator [Hydrogenophaga palleronii]MDR7149750.1 DNA-binding CsgD family transcriptional regulator/PAS domain-containing protein [Hydrogenophaga palleronii]
MSTAYLRKPDELLVDLYASAAQPERWTQSMDRLCSITGAQSAVVQAFRFEQGRAQVFWSAQDSRTRDTTSVQSPELASGDNPRMDQHRVLRGLDRVASDDLLFDPEDEARPRLQQRLATLGLGRFMGTLQDVGRGVYLGLALHRSVDDATNFGDEHVNRLADLAPHLGQAFLLTDQLQVSVQRDERLCRLMDSLCFGIVLCNVEGRVQWANQQALAMLERNPTLSLRGDHLHGRTAADTQALLTALSGARRAGQQRVGYLRLGEDADQVLHVAIRPGDDPAALMLVISRAAQPLDLPALALESLFGLTPTEARLLGAIATGSTVEEYAQLRGVSVGTARMQLKQIQAKTGQRRQADLVRLVLSSAAAHLVAPGSRI